MKNSSTINYICFCNRWQYFQKHVNMHCGGFFFIAHRTTSGERVGIKGIANGISSPEHFLAKILQDLSRRGLIQSAKGPKGGF